MIALILKSYETDSSKCSRKESKITRWCTFVICPVSIMTQWKVEVFDSYIDIEQYHGKNHEILVG